MENRFLIQTNHENPPHNTVMFEEFFCKKFLTELPETKREVLPVCWTNYYVSKDYCNGDMSDIQEYLDSLDRSKAYFTVCQWDDGIVNNTDGLDLFVFSSGGIGDYPYPLNCLPHPIDPVTFTSYRHVLGSFMGAIQGRHPVREKMAVCLWEKEGIHISERITFNDFQAVMGCSLFALCPRGYGKTSFRICEALQFGAIPVYIYDDPWIPFYDIAPFEEYGVLCDIKDIDSLYDKLKSYSPADIDIMRDKGADIYRDYYSYNGCYDRIIESPELL